MNSKMMPDIVGLKFIDIFKQVDMFILNFGQGIQCSLHTFTFCRILDESHVYFTSNDQYFTKNYRYRTEKGYRNDEFCKNSLLNESLKNVKNLLKEATVDRVDVLDNGDIEIIFDNGIKFQSLIDHKELKFEYYRWIEFIPSFEDYRRRKPCTTIHTIVRFKNGKIDVEKTENDLSQHNIDD